jgi:hypothetical protein
MSTTTTDAARRRGDAGYSRFTVLPTEHEAFRFYRLDP